MRSLRQTVLVSQACAGGRRHRLSGCAVYVLRTVICFLTAVQIEKKILKQ